MSGVGMGVLSRIQDRHLISALAVSIVAFAETGPAFLAGAGGIGAIESLEDPRQVLTGDAGAGVADEDRHSVRVAAREAVDGAAGRGTRGAT